MYATLGAVGRVGLSGGVSGGAGKRPTLSLDFMHPGALDPKIAFTRASAATYFDSTGTMHDCGCRSATVELRSYLAAIARIAA